MVLVGSLVQLLCIKVLQEANLSAVLLDKLQVLIFHPQLFIFTVPTSCWQRHILLMGLLVVAGVLQGQRKNNQSVAKKCAPKAVHVSSSRAAAEAAAAAAEQQQQQQWWWWRQ
jgi:hypothetical protein